MTLDRSVDNQSGQNKLSVRSVCSQEASEMEKERETKEDGRYIIFYSFGNQETREGGDG
jgi:hypothetical protein